jgi:hypothetical protein
MKNILILITITLSLFVFWRRLEYIKWKAEPNPIFRKVNVIIIADN